MKIWILTFNRPDALNRLVSHFTEQRFNVNIFSNHPTVMLEQHLRPMVNKVVINTLNSHESNSWCARSWNTMYMKTFDDDNEGIFIQDDTDIGPNFGNWILENKKKYDFIWGPAGDQFHYITKDVFLKTGWWDERYIGCYAGDAEYLKRVCMVIPYAKASIVDTHNWGFRHNDCGIEQNIITTYQSKTVDKDYENQHWEFERICGAGGQTTETNPVILHAQDHFRKKWGVDLDNGKPVITNLERKLPEIDWYPWFTKKHGVTTHALYSTQG